MNQEVDNQRRGISGRVVLIVMITMAIIYFVFGCWLLIFDKPVFNLSNSNKLILGSVFILYSFYRAYIIYTRYFRKPKIENED